MIDDVVVQIRGLFQFIFAVALLTMSALLYAASAVLDLPAAPLPQALDRLAQVMDLQIKKPEKGSYTTDEALTYLLADSGFQAQKTEQSRYLVQESKSVKKVQQLPEMTVTGASANPEWSGYTTTALTVSPGRICL